MSGHAHELELRQALSEDPADPQLWAVYADVRLARDPRDPQGLAITRSLSGQPPDPGALGILDPDEVAIGWHRGLWRAAVLRSARPTPGGGSWTAAVLAHPAAALLRRLELPIDALDPAALAEAPPSLRELVLTTTGAALPSLAEVGPLLQRLELLEIRGPLAHLGGGAARLRRLVIGEVRRTTALSMPHLEVLEVGGIQLRLLSEALQPQDVPALRSLILRGRAPPEQLRRLLASPAGQQLQRLELETGQALPALLDDPDAWRHLSTVLVDLALGEERRVPPSPRLRVRHAAPQQEPIVFLRLQPPATAVELAHALEQGCADLGVRIEPPPLADWLSVPDELAERLAHRVAIRAGVPVHRLVLVVSGSPWASVGAWAREVGPDGSEQPIHFDLSRRTVSASPLREAPPTRDELIATFWDGLQTAVVRCWLPVGWRPDPYELVPPMRIGPRELQRGRERLQLPLEVAGYLAWRAGAAEVLQLMPAPDLGRWTRRLLRRHQLLRLPDEDHAYWDEWRRLTHAERARTAEDARKIVSYKLLAPGRWLLVDPEPQLLSTALRDQLAHHAPTNAQHRWIDRLVRFLDGGGPVQITVA